MKTYKNFTYVTPANDADLTEAARRAWDKLSEDDRAVLERELRHLQALDGSNSAGQNRVYIRGLGPKGAMELLARVGMALAKGGGIE